MPCDSYENAMDYRDSFERELSMIAEEEEYTKKSLKPEEKMTQDVLARLQVRREAAQSWLNYFESEVNRFVHSIVSGG